MKPEWDALQTDISKCELCRLQFPEIAVDCPPGLILPRKLNLPARVKVLFIGVAPPEKGRHFYSDSSDKLRNGLFKVLTDLKYPCQTIEDFLSHTFFLLHTAKCAIKGTTEPWLPVSQFCSNQHLRREIELLQPESICWLSRKVGYNTCQALCHEWGVPERVPFGKVTSTSIMGRTVHQLPTKWPGRGWENETRAHLASLFDRLSESKPKL